MVDIIKISKFNPLTYNKDFKDSNVLKLLDDFTQSFTLRLREDKFSPTQTFYIDLETLKFIKKYRSDLGRELTCNELLKICIDLNYSCATDFVTNSINLINRLYYSCSFAFDKESGLADMYVRNKIINKSFGRLINNLFLDQKSLKIKEFSSGSNPNKWKYILPEVSNKDISITLSDFDNSALPKANIVVEGFESVEFGFEKYSLFDELSKLNEKEKVEVSLITYGFDSIWQEEDIRYTKYNDSWYRTLYRIKVKDDFVKKYEMISALKTGIPYEGIEPRDFDSIFIEVLLDRVEDLNKVPFANYILEEYEAESNISFGFPGGMIKKVVEAFDNQLDENGIFIIGDVGRFNLQNKYGIHTRLDYSESGIGAKYKEEDYYLAKNILQKEFGFVVDIYSLEDFVEEFAGLDWKNSAAKDEVYEIEGNPNNFVMVIRK